MKLTHLMAAALAALLFEQGAGAAEAAARPWTGYVVYPGTSRVRTPRAEPPRRIIFMNRDGGTYTYGEDDSSTNTSRIVSTPSGVAEVPPWHLDDAAWRSVMACIRLQYGRFNVEVTDVDPGAVTHIEAVVSGYDYDVGISGAGGISPIGCEVVERAITYTFAAMYGDDIQTICEVVAQETAHAVGLDHELLCSDPLTYLPGCGPKTFQDQAAPCGESVQRPCFCNSTQTQNSVATLRQMLGPAETVPPTVAVTSPADGATVRSEFTVEVEAQDNYVVTKVDLWIDGVVRASDGEAPFALQAPAGLAAGPHTLEVRAYDPGSNLGTATLSVTIAPDCAADGDCTEWQVCEQNVCLGDVGAGCTNNDQCAGGFCVVGDDDTRFCTTECAQGADACPSGYACQQSGAGTLYKCWPAAGDGGGCATSRRAAGLPAALAVLVGLALALRRRRSP